jgi:hypothetical protein
VTLDPSLSSLHPLFLRWPMATDSPNLPKAETWMRQLESHVTEITQALKTLLDIQAQQTAPDVLPSILNPASEGSRASPTHHEPLLHKQTANGGNTQHIKPSSPNDFRGDCMKGQTFLNLCELYVALAPHQFANDNMKIMWAFLFMKSGHAMRFVDQHMRSYQNVGSILYETWGEFVEDFMVDFCPKNKVQTSRTELETLRFFQNGKTIDKYIDNFKELVNHA